MSLTVWVYSHDAAAHHDNDLAKDTFDSLKEALKVARERCQATTHNTGYAFVVDNGIAGHQGDRGVVARFQKSKSGKVRREYLREHYGKLLWRSRITGQGLLALFNPGERMWEYYRQLGSGAADLEKTGSTLIYTH